MHFHLPFISMPYSHFFLSRGTFPSRSAVFYRRFCPPAARFAPGLHENTSKVRPPCPTYPLPPSPYAVIMILSEIFFLRRPHHGKNGAHSERILLQPGLPQNLQHRHGGHWHPNRASHPPDVPLLVDQRGPGRPEAPGPGVQASARHHRVHPCPGRSPTWSRW